MALPKLYSDRNCSIARSLEVIGERWTLLILRDAFYGVRRFSDFAEQLSIPRAVLSSRLRTLVEEGVMAREGDGPGALEYALTAKGLALWPVLRSLMEWGDDYYSQGGPRRTFLHDIDDAPLDADGVCSLCGTTPQLTDIRLVRGPGFDPRAVSRDAVSEAIDTERRLLEPVGNWR